MTYNEKDQLLTRSDIIKKGEKIRTRLHQGELVSIVEKVNNKPE